MTTLVIHESLFRQVINRQKSKAAIQAFRVAGMTTNRPISLAKSTFKEHGSVFVESVITSSSTLRPYLTATQLKFLGDFADVEVFQRYAFPSKVRKRGFKVSKNTGGLYNWREREIYLPHDAKLGNVVHEAIHAFSTAGRSYPPFSMALGAFLYEGITQLYTDLALKDFGWDKLIHHDYADQLKAAKGLVKDIGFATTANAYFRQSISSAVTELSRRSGLSLLKIQKSARCDQGRGIAEQLGYL